MIPFFLHGRPAAHPLHVRYGKEIGGRFILEDSIMRWQDRDYPAPVRYLAWVINAFWIVRFKKTLVVTEGIRITAVLAKLFSFNRIRLIGLVADESSFFIYSSFYKGLSLRVNRWTYQQYDGFLCIGLMETQLIDTIVRDKVPVRTGFNGISAERMRVLTRMAYQPMSNRIVFIGNGPASWRAWYKGIDLMLQVFDSLIDSGHDLVFEIAGEWDTTELLRLVKGRTTRARIRFVGKISALEFFLSNAVLYLHTARGEAWGISVNEAMAAGVVPIVSEWTGSKECVQKVSEELVVPLDETIIKQRILWYLNLSVEEKQRLSKKCRDVAMAYTEELAVKRFREMFLQVAGEIGC